jgi:hypothetical protein
VPSLLTEALALLVLGSYTAAWWFAIWLLLGRPHQPALSVLLGVVLLGYVVPLMLDDATAVNPQVPRVLPFLWAALPVPVLCAFALYRWWSRRFR